MKFVFGKLNLWSPLRLMCALGVCFGITTHAVAQEEEEMSIPDSLFVYAEVERPFYEHIPDYSYELVGDRISCMDKDIDITYNERVKAFVDYFAIRDREYTRMVVQRMEVYFPLFEKYLEKYNMPDDLKYLSIVESGLNPKAISRVGAAGLWQFMPGTGRIFRLDRSWFIDERMDPEKATEAACKYLKQLHGMFNDWELALAAYNAGPGNVRKAVRRSGYKKDFWEVYNYLPRETRSYVPQFAAITYLMNHLEEHNFYLEEHEYQRLVQVDTVHMDRFMSIEVLEEELNLCPGEISSLNPELIRNAVPEDAGNYALKVPSHAYASLSTNREAIYASTEEKNKQQLAHFTRNEVGSTYNREKITYRVQRGDYLGKIADRHNVRVADIRHWNRLSGNTIRIGQNLSIYVSPKQKASINTQLAQAGSGNSNAVEITNGKVHYVQPGDTLWEISKKYGGISVAQIKKLNNLTSNNIKAGQRLVISK